MSKGARRLALGCVLGVTMLVGSLAAPPVSAQECDASYPDFCLPNLGYDAYNCDDVGLDNFTVYPPDINGFDADYDGIGCEA